VVERANKVIKQIFETEKYDLILQDVVFAGPRVDITEKVIKALNAGKPRRPWPPRHAAGRVVAALATWALGGDWSATAPSRMAPLEAADAGSISFLANPRYRPGWRPLPLPA
jgi:hypothetical protein